MASRREQEAAAAVLVQAESLLVQSRADNALALLVKLERTTPGAKGLAELLAVAQVLAAVGYTPECPRCRRPIGPLPKDYVDWFGVLQVDARTDEAGIKKRYRQLALLLHPDKNKSQKAEAAFRYVKEAHTILTDSNKRAVFDSLRSRLPPCPCSAPAGGRAMGVQRGAGGFRASQGYASYLSPTGSFRNVPNRSSSYSSFARNTVAGTSPMHSFSAARGSGGQHQYQQQQHQYQQQQQYQKQQGGRGSAPNLHQQAASGASWAGNEAGRLQELREQAKARVVSLEREWEEKKEQWLRDFEQAKVQQQAQQQEQQEREEQEEREEREEQQQAQQQEQEEQQEQEQQAEREAEGEGEQEGEEETDVAKGRHGDEKSDGTTGIPEENSDLVGDSIWEQLADLVDDADVDDADVESEGQGRREGSNWSGSSGAQEDREAQTEVRKEGREKLEDKTVEKQAEKQAENQAEKQAEKRAEKRAEEQGSEAVEVTLSSPDVHGHGNSGRQVEREGDKEGVRAAVGSGATLSGAACTGDLHTSFRATTSGRAAADAMAAAAAATEAARKVLERSRSVLRKASVRAEECSVRPERADEAGGAGEADGAGKKDTESEAGRVSASSVPGGAEGSGVTCGSFEAQSAQLSKVGKGSADDARCCREDSGAAAEGMSAAGAAVEAAAAAAVAAADAAATPVPVSSSNHLSSSTASAPASSESCSASGQASVRRSPGADSPISSTRASSSGGAAGHSSVGTTWVAPCSSGNRTGGKDDIGGSKEGRGGGKEGKESKEGSGDVLVTLQRLRRDTQAVAASLDNLRRRLSARPAAVFPAADFPVDDFPATAAGIVPVVTGSPPVQVPAS
ncbi:unnamed protein product [Closterium sp. NIES-54]